MRRWKQRNVLWAIVSQDLLVNPDTKVIIQCDAKHGWRCFRQRIHLTRRGQRCPPKLTLAVADVLVNTTKSCNTYEARWISLCQWCNCTVQCAVKSVVFCGRYTVSPRLRGDDFTLDNFFKDLAIRAFPSSLVKDGVIVSCVHLCKPWMSMTRATVCI